MLRAVLNKSSGQHPTKRQFNDHQSHISKTFQTRRARHARHYWRCKGELISDVPLWTPSLGLARVGRLAKPNLQQLCSDTGYSMEELAKAMDDKNKC